MAKFRLRNVVSVFENIYGCDGEMHSAGRGCGLNFLQ